MLPLNKKTKETINNMKIETITNENGTAIKFSNGTMICSMHITVTDQAINSSYGDIFTGIRNWIFPVQFVEKPIVSCGMFKWGTSASWSGVSGIGNSSASLVGYDLFSRETGTNVNISAIAIRKMEIKKEGRESPMAVHTHTHTYN